METCEEAWWRSKRGRKRERYMGDEGLEEDKGERKGRGIGS